MVNIGERPIDSGSMSGGPQRRTLAILAGLVLIVAVVGAALMMRGDESDDSQTVTAAAGAADAADAGTGTLRVRLEPVDGIFVEGFEVGLRFETAAGEVIASTLWSDHVESLDEPSWEAYYESELDQVVPAGPVILRAEVNIGMGPGPSIPDLDGELPCWLDVEVGPGEVVIVEVSFNGENDCLRLHPGDGPTTSDPEPDRSTTAPDPASPAPTVPGTTTDAVAAEPVPPEQGPLAVGTSHYVEVDLQCEAFMLGGIWVLVEGDPPTWQAPGERHEGGTLTIEAPGLGRFVGDAAQTKVATFRMMGPTEGAPACLPAPRPQPPT